MFKFTVSSFVAIGLSISSMAYAQDTTTAAEDAVETATDKVEEVVEGAVEKAEEMVKEAAETAAPAAPTVEDETFPVAQEETAPEDQIGAEYIKEAHGDWQIVCINLPEGQAPQCRLFQLLKDASGNAVAEISLIKLQSAEKAAAGINFITPLGTLLTAQASMRVDAGQTKRYPFSWCDQGGCIARFGLTPDELNNLKRGNKAVMSIVSIGARDKPISLDVSLTGITAGWNALVGG